MSLPSTEIAAAHDPAACGYYALINLWRLYGATPPPFERMAAAQLMFLRHDTLFARRAGGATLHGLNVFDQLRLLTCFFYPGFVAVGALHAARPPRQTLAPLLARGLGLILNYTWRRADGAPIGHSVVAEGCDAEGYIVLDSSAARRDGERIEMAPDWTPESIAEFRARAARQTHGARCLLPYDVPLASERAPLGLSTYFIFAERRA